MPPRLAGYHHDSGADCAPDAFVPTRVHRWPQALPPSVGATRPAAATATCAAMVASRASRAPRGTDSGPAAFTIAGPAAHGAAIATSRASSWALPRR